MEKQIQEQEQNNDFNGEVEGQENSIDFNGVDPNIVRCKVDRLIVKINFRDGQSLDFKLTSTGQKNVTCVVDNKLSLMLGRLYYIPVDTKLKSDNYTLKILSSIADQIDVRYIKDEIACIMPLQHNIVIENGQEICLITDLTNN